MAAKTVIMRVAEEANKLVLDRWNLSVNICAKLQIGDAVGR